MEIARERDNANKKMLLVILLEIIAILLLAVFTILLLVSRADRYQERLSMGDKYLAEMNYEDAKICYRNAIRIDEKKAEGYVGLSEVYASQNQYDVAWDILELGQERVSTPKRREIIRTQMTVVEDAREEYEKEDKKAEEVKEEEQPAEQNEQESKDPLYTAGYRFVARNGWAYTTDQTGLYICEGNVVDPDKTITGSNIAYRLMAVDDGVYFSLNNNSLVFYDREANEQTVVYTGDQYVEPLGMTEQYLYFTEMPSADADEQDVLQMNREDGSIRRFSLPNFCIHSSAAFCGERFFYTKGVADVSSSSLYEVNPQTGETTQLEDSTGSQIFVRDQTLYYIRAAASGDLTKLAKEIVAWDLKSDERSTLLGGSGMELNGIALVTEQAVYYTGSGVLGVIRDGNVSAVSAGDFYSVLGEAEGGLYYQIGQDIFYYDETSAQNTRVFTLSDGIQPVGAAYGRIVYQTQTGLFWEDLEG